MTLERGTLLHKRYRIVEILGQGGMGSVYRAVDENLGVDVAVKENLFTTDEYARQFRLEAVILASLRHPNLPRVSDHFAVGDQGQYLIMDFIEGEDLRQRMERMGTVTEDDAIMVGAAMCDALAYLHTRKPSILHRDIKPGNVKITPEGNIYLVDFGLAKLVQGTQATTTGARAMTPGYSPPEQYGTARTDPRTDIYSLGATLYAALTGMIPEDGLARAMDNAQLTPLRKRNPKVGRRLAAAIEKAMAVDPADRFQTAEDFKKALLGSRSRTERPTGDFTVSPPPVLDGAPNGNTPAVRQSEPKTPGIPLPPFMPDQQKVFVPPARKRRRSPWGLTLLFALIMLAAGIIILYPNELYPRMQAVLPAVQAVLPLDRLALPFAAPTATPTSHPPTATALPPTATPVPPTATPLPPTPTSTRAPTSTPDTPLVETPTLNPHGSLGGGRGQFAFASDRSGIPQVYISDLAGTSVKPVTNMRNGACQPSWAPDGEHFVFVSPCPHMLDLSDPLPEDTSLFISNADGSEVVPLPSGAEGDSEPAWSPDGTRIAFTSVRDGRPLIYVLTLADRVVTRVVEPSSSFDIAREPAWSPFSNELLFAKKRAGAYQIWAVTDGGQGEQQIVRSGQAYWDYQPVWSPDGSTIAFAERNADGPVQPWVMSMAYEERDSSASAQIDLGPLPIENLRYSPDGRWLMFESVSEGNNHDLFIATIDGQERTRLTTDPGVDFDPAWRPLHFPLH
jgi:eukaryotic-like serine/threonine-protein kinase